MAARPYARCMPTPAALGFKLHTGWAMLVALTGSPATFEVLLRRRIELLPPGDVIPRFMYHRAAEIPLMQATKLIQQAAAAASDAARIAVGEALDHLRSLGVTVKAAGIASASKPVPADLSAVLRSHPIIHTAEAALFQRALATACEDSGLAVTPREREVWGHAAKASGLKEALVRKRVEDLRKSVGAPWGSDQKLATAYALLALALHH
jgi:hypothetical protein